MDIYHCFRRYVWERMHDLNRLAGRAIKSFWRRLRGGKNLQEPDITAALTMEFPKYVNALHEDWKIGGSFIHQRPYIKYVDKNGNTCRCELGDLLLLCRKRVDGEDRFNAMLLQLKMMHRPCGYTVTAQNELTQLEVYVHWPKFTMQKTNVDYDLKPKVATPGAQYLYVANCYPYNLLINNESRIEFNRCYSSFGRLISDFVNWQNGRPISDEAHKDDDLWSKLIWDLINVNKGIIYHRRNVNVAADRNGGLEFLLYTTKEDVNSGIPYEDIPANELPDGGIPMLFIDVDSEEEKRG